MRSWSSQSREHLHCISPTFNPSPIFPFSHFHFETFWDLRRFIITLRAVSDLRLVEVTWPTFSELPSIPFIAHSLQRVFYQANDAAFGDILWFWGTTRTPPPLGLKHQREAKGDAKHPPCVPLPSHSTMQVPLDRYWISRNALWSFSGDITAKINAVSVTFILAQYSCRLISCPF